MDLICNQGKFLPLLVQTTANGFRLDEVKDLGIVGHEYPSLEALILGNSSWLKFPVAPNPPTGKADAISPGSNGTFDPHSVGVTRGLSAAAEAMAPSMEGIEEGDVLQATQGIGQEGGARLFEGSDEAECLMANGDLKL